jgi:hypothetical protein
MERKSKLKLLTGAAVLMFLLSGCGGNSLSGNTADAVNTGNTDNTTVEGQTLDNNSSSAQNEAGTAGTTDSVTSGPTDPSVSAEGSGTESAAADQNGTTDTSAQSVTKETEPKSSPAPVSSPSKADTATKPTATKPSSGTATKPPSGTASGTKSTTNTDKSATTQGKTVVMAKIVKISSSSITVLESTQSLSGGMRGAKPGGTPKAADSNTSTGATTDTTPKPTDGTAQPGRMGGGRAITFSDTQTTYSLSSTTVVTSMESGAEASIKLTDLIEGDIVMIELSSDKKSATHVTKRPSPAAAGTK